MTCLPSPPAPRPPPPPPPPSRAPDRGQARAGGAGVRRGAATAGPQTGEGMGCAAPAEPRARLPAGPGGSLAAVPGSGSSRGPAEPEQLIRASQLWRGSEGLGGTPREVVSELWFPLLGNRTVSRPHRDARGSVKAPCCFHAPCLDCSSGCKEPEAPPAHNPEPLFSAGCVLSSRRGDQQPQA